MTKQTYFYGHSTSMLYQPLIEENIFFSQQQCLEKRKKKYNEYSWGFIMQK